jgi:carboxypeptidase PM20D1
MFRMAAYGIALATLSLIAVLAVRTMTYGPPGEQSAVAGADFEIDAQLAAGNLSKALRIRTVSRSVDLPPDSEAFGELHELLRTSFPLVDQAMTRETVAGYSLLYTWQGTDPGLDPILFSAHMDVVPVEPGTEADWTYPAFSGEIADGFIWGRGALDMKQSLSAYMQAAEALIARGFAPERTIHFAFTHDEELGAVASREITALLESRGVNLFFTLDEGLVIADGLVPGVSKPVALLGVAQKGYLTVEIVVRGEGGHGSMPPADAVNARLARAVLAVTDNPMPARLEPPVSQMFEYLAPEMGLMNRLILANLWLFGPVLISRLEASPATNAHIRTTFAPTILESGLLATVLPQKGRAVFKIRILPGESIDQTLEFIRNRIGDWRIEINVIGSDSSEPSPVSDVDSPSFQMLRQTVHQVFPDVVSAPGLFVGTTDSSRYQRIADNSYLFLPSRLKEADLPRIHGTDERIAVDNYVEIIRFYAQLMMNTASDIQHPE